MLTLLKNLWMLANYPWRMRLEREKQKREGYVIEKPEGSRAEYVVYREGEKWVEVFIDASWKDGIRIYTQSLKEWQAPEKGKILSQSEYDRALKRVSEYFSIEGDVTLDDSPLITDIEQLASVKEI